MRACVHTQARIKLAFSARLCMWEVPFSYVRGLIIKLAP